MNKVAGWIFTYNEYTKNWQAATRENSSMLFNDMMNSKVLKSPSFNTLIDIIIRTQGDPTKLKKLVK